MSSIELQLKTEARYDVIVNCTLLALLFVGLLFLPRAAFWWYWVPIVAFYLRYTWVRVKRDEALRLALDGLGNSGSGTARCYSTESGICISQGSQHILVARQNVDAALQLPHVVGNE
jgi:hypothetical protein